MARKKERGVLPDAGIVELFFERNEKAIEEADAKYRRYLLKVAQNILGDELDSEEILNDTYLSAWDSIPPTRPAVLGAFLSQIMRRLAINRYNKRKCQKEIGSEYTVSLDELVECLHSDDQAYFDGAELGRLISGFVRELPARQRSIFIERFYMSATVEDIARELSLSPATVYREITKIKEDLRSYLERNGVYL